MVLGKRHVLKELLSRIAGPSKPGSQEIVDYLARMRDPDFRAFLQQGLGQVYGDVEFQPTLNHRA